ncbi:MAG: hypothetical protein PHE54_04825 [Bacilli bacterium]|nr:hypothetical protein [Bacilli bacterium]
MKTRMEKYYNVDLDTKKRTKLNESLYREIYENIDYTNIEKVEPIEKSNEIDIMKIRELLRSNVEPKNASNQVVKKREPVFVTTSLEEEKVYDIRDVLSKAKDEKKPDDEPRSLKNTQYDILKGLKIKEQETNDDELKELINTITNTSLLNKLGDKELSLNMLSELQSLNNTCANDLTSVKNILEETKKVPKETIKEEIDKTFYTSSMEFKNEDFDELKDSLKKSNGLIKAVIIILFIVIIVASAFVFYTLLK